MNNIIRWMLSNRLKLNIKKSCAMLIGSPQKIKELRLDISILGEPLMNVTKTKYLGVVVDNHLKWKEHISYLKQLIMFKIICLKRLLPLPKSTIMLLYRTYILPILDYCDCVWSCASATLLKSLDRIHYRFFKLVDRTEVPSTNSLPPSLILNNRRVFHVVLQTYKILKRICPNYLCDLVRFSRDVTGRNSKNTYRVYVPYARTNYGKEAFYFKATSIWNNLRLIKDIYPASNLADFKSKYKLIYLT